MAQRYSFDLNGQTVSFDWDHPTPPTPEEIQAIAVEHDPNQGVDTSPRLAAMSKGTGGWPQPATTFDPKHWEEPIPPSGWQTTKRLGMRVGVPLAATAATWASGGVTSPLLLAALGAGSGALGEYGAERDEAQPGPGQIRDSVNAGQVAMQGALNAVPMGAAVGPEVSLGRAALNYGLRGAALGGPAAAVTAAAEGQYPSWADVGQGAAGGFGLGAVIGGAAHWGANRVPAGAAEPPPPPPPAFDPTKPSMAPATQTAAGGGLSTDTWGAMPPSVPAGPGAPPGNVADAFVSGRAEPARTPLGWQLRSTPGGAEGSWSAPVPGGLVRDSLGRLIPRPGHEGGTTTGMDIPLQDFEATGAWDRRATSGNPALAPEPPPPGSTTPPPDAGASLPPGEPGGPSGSTVAEPTFAPGEDNTLAGLRTQFAAAIKAKDINAANALAREIRAREGAQRGTASIDLVSDLGSATAGGIAGYSSSDPEDTWQEKLMRTLGGAAAGLGGKVALRNLSAGAKPPRTPGRTDMSRRGFFQAIQTGTKDFSGYISDNLAGDPALVAQKLYELRQIPNPSPQIQATQAKLSHWLIVAMSGPEEGASAAYQVQIGKILANGDAREARGLRYWEDPTELPALLAGQKAKPFGKLMSAAARIAAVGSEQGYENALLREGESKVALPEVPAAPKGLPDVQHMAAPEGGGRVQGKVIDTTGMKADVESMGKVLGQSLYAKPQPFVATKELVQNSADAVRGQKDGHIEVHYNDSYQTDNPFIEVRDNGAGMNLQELKDYFLTMGGSGKRNDATASGGFGVASVSPLLGGKRIELRTTKADAKGRLVTLAFEGTPEEILGQRLKIIQADVPDAKSGTHIRVSYEKGTSVPEYEINEFVKRSAQGSSIPKLTVYERANRYSGRPIGYDGLHTPEHLRVANPEPLRKFDTFGKKRTYSVEGADIDIYDEPITPDEQHGVPISVYNNGTYQLSGSMSHGQGFVGIPDLPARSHVNIRPTVAEGTPNYPFVANREGLNDAFSGVERKAVEAHYQPYIDAYLKKLDAATSGGPTLSNGVKLFDHGGRITPEDTSRIDAIPGAPQMYFRLAGITQRIIDHLYPVEGKQVTHVGALLSGEHNGGVRVRNGIGDQAKMGLYVNPFAVLQHLGDNPNPRDVANGIYHVMLHESTHIEAPTEGAKFTWALFRNEARTGLQQKNWWIESIRKAISDPNNPDQLSASFHRAREVNQDIGGRRGSGATPNVEGVDRLGRPPAPGGSENPPPGDAGPGGQGGGGSAPVDLSQTGSGTSGPGTPPGPRGPDGNPERGAVGINPLVRGTGAVLGGVTGFASGDEDQTLEERLLRGAAGAAVGYAGGRLLTRASTLAPGSGIPKLQQQREAQYARSSPQAATAFEKVMSTRSKYYEALTPVQEFLHRMVEKTGVTPPSETGFPNLANIRGGQGGIFKVVKDRYDAVGREASKAKLIGYVEEYLNLKGMGHAGETIRLKAQEAYNKGDIQAYHTMINDLLAGKDLPLGFTPGEVARTEADFARRAGARLPAIKAYADRIIALNKEALDVMEKGDLIRPAVAAKLRQRSGDYVTMSRIMDAVTEYNRYARGTSMQLKRQKVLFNLEGSERINKNPMTASSARYAEAIYEAGRNEATQNVASWAGLHPDYAKEIRDITHGAPKAGEVPLGYFVKGERKTIAVPEALGRGLMIANSGDIIGVGKVLNTFNQILRNSVITLSPVFSMANAVKDFAASRRMSSGGANGINKLYRPDDYAGNVKQWIQALGDTWQHGPQWQEMMNNRGGYGTLTRQFQEEDLLTFGHERNLAEKIRDGMGHLSNTAEENTKSVAYQRAKAAGLSPVDAAYETRTMGGSPDFGGKGTLGTQAGSAWVFFNAGVRGIGRIGTAIKANPVKWGLMAAGATLTNLARDAFNRQYVDSDGVDAIDKVTDWDRKNYYVVVTPQTYVKDGVTRHYVVKHVKGHEDKTLSNPIEDLIDMWRGSGKVDRNGDLIPTKTGTQVALDAASNLVPGNMQINENEGPLSAAYSTVGNLSPFFKVPISQLSNRDLSFGQPMIPRRLEDASPSEQWDEKTSPSIVKFTNALKSSGAADWSPIRIQQALKDMGLTSGIPGAVLGGLDAANADPSTQRPAVGPEALTRHPVYGQLARKFLGSSLDQTARDREERFYQALGRADSASRDNTLALQSLGKRSRKDFEIDPSTGKPNNPDRFMALVSSKDLTATSLKLSNIRKAMRITQAQGGDNEVAMTALVHAEDEIIKGALSMLNSMERQFKAPPPKAAGRPPAFPPSSNP